MLAFRCALEAAKGFFRIGIPDQSIPRNYTKIGPSTPKALFSSGPEVALGSGYTYSRRAEPVRLFRSPAK
jgi:hypothetical protein